MGSLCTEQNRSPYLTIAMITNNTNMANNNNNGENKWIIVSFKCHSLSCGARQILGAPPSRKLVLISKSLFLILSNRAELVLRASWSKSVICSDYLSVSNEYRLKYKKYNMNPTTEYLTCFTISPVMSVLGKATEKQVDNKECKGKYRAHTKSYVESLIVARFVVIVKRVCHKLCLVV